jgi:hypothetical protein
LPRFLVSAACAILYDPLVIPWTVIRRIFRRSSKGEATCPASAGSMKSSMMQRNIND